MTDERISPSQLAGATLWRIATSERTELASSDSKAYRAAERAFIAILRAEYGLGATLAQRVRDCLAEYGPNDSLTWDWRGNTLRGVASYVAYVKANRGRQI